MTKLNTPLPNQVKSSNKAPHNEVIEQYKGADKSLPRPGRKQATATEDFEFHISY